MAKRNEIKVEILEELLNDIEGINPECIVDHIYEQIGIIKNRIN
jgi:hypothetical protein